MNSPNKDHNHFGMGSPRKSMLSPQKNKKIEIEKNQLRTSFINTKGVILNDFKKVKTKCESLFNDLGE